MTRAAVTDYDYDEELPDLATLLSLPASMRCETEGVRRSPRKQTSVQLYSQRSPETSNTLHRFRRSPKGYEAPTTSFSAKKRQTTTKSSPSCIGPARSTGDKKLSRNQNRLLQSTLEPKSERTNDESLINTNSCPRTILGDISTLPRRRDSVHDFDTERVESISVSSNSRLSPKLRKPTDGSATKTSHLKLPHVDSLLLPLSKIALSTSANESDDEDGEIRTKIGRRRQSKKSLRPAVTSRFVLSEAQCPDDSMNSDDQDEEDEEDTDLSGFIVDDDADISFHDSVDSCSDYEESQYRTQKSSAKRRLQRGSPVRTSNFDADVDSDLGSGSNKENDASRADHSDLQKSMRKMDVGKTQVSETLNTSGVRRAIEVIDLTSSPIKAASSSSDVGPDLDWKSQRPSVSRKITSPVKKSSTTESTSTTFEEDFDAILSFSPSQRYSPTKKTLLEKEQKSQSESSLRMFRSTVLPTSPPAQSSASNNIDNPATPRTPPRTPSKSQDILKSPSKLLSPSKKSDIPRSPHRQSVDAFWDLEVVNTWNDTYSPKKAPQTSPLKVLERFEIWEDSDEDISRGGSTSNGLTSGSGDSSSLPSPCSSPTKTGSRSRLTSPAKSTVNRSPTKAKPKNPEREAKKLFNTTKNTLAQTLLADLDANVTSNKIRDLAANTGGVKIIWSKTLRSTAGRANWKRTVTRLSDSPAKGRSSAENTGEVKVCHHTSIELAEKIVDNESRLVNTLAHEFCHLANFMVSGVRDQPHGASFKAWAAKVTAYLRKDGKATGDSVRQAVEVTTKHAYVIEYKYLWLCAGREQNAAMKFLGLDGEGGCGGEYGRHSRSIDVERQRCGRCKGTLVQVRPKPRTSPVPTSAGQGLQKTRVSREESVDSLGGLERGMDVVELSD